MSDEKEDSQPLEVEVVPPDEKQLSRNLHPPRSRNPLVPLGVALLIIMLGMFWLFRDRTDDVFEDEQPWGRATATYESLNEDRTEGDTETDTARAAVVDSRPGEGNQETEAAADNSAISGGEIPPPPRPEEITSDLRGASTTVDNRDTEDRSAPETNRQVEPLVDSPATPAEAPPPPRPEEIAADLGSLKTNPPDQGAGDDSPPETLEAPTDPVTKTTLPERNDSGTAASSADETLHRRPSPEDSTTQPKPVGAQQNTPSDHSRTAENSPASVKTPSEEAPAPPNDPGDPEKKSPFPTRNEPPAPNQKDRPIFQR